MNRALVTVMAVATAGVLSGCGAESGQEAVDSSEQQSILAGGELTASRTVLSPTISGAILVKPPRGELIGKENPELRKQFSPLDAHMAALARATLKCKGSIDPDDYDGSSGYYLKARFEKCDQDEKSFQHIQNLLGIQNVDKNAGRHFAYTWESGRKGFPRDEIKVCPRWEHLESINSPSFETVKQLPPGAIGEEFNSFYVKSEICQDNRCAVSHAVACAAGTGSQFLVKANPETAEILTDPVWWLDDTDYATDASNPFLSPGYYHAMSFYGSVPGAVYGAVNRENEYCSKYYNGYHYKLRLRAVYCAADWICMTECR